MSLSTKQLTLLRHDLVALASIEYDDVMNELLDHYASLTEQKMTNGMSFDDASKWAWSELGSGEGIQRIQTDYEKSIRSQVRNQHLHILKSYFQWPTLLPTALVSILIFLTMPHLSVKLVGGIILVLTLCPSLLLIWGYFKFVDSRISTGKAVWQYMQHKGFLPLNLLQIGLNFPKFFLDNELSTRTFLQEHPTITVALCLVSLLYTISFIQLYWRKFYYKIA